MLRAARDIVAPTASTCRRPPSLARGFANPRRWSRQRHKDLDSVLARSGLKDLRIERLDLSNGVDARAAPELQVDASMHVPPLEEWGDDAFLMGG
jgi:hypothetical protein